jgi:transposase
VVSDVLGVSGRAMLAALVTGNRDPHSPADLAKGSRRRKTDALIEALTGYFTDHHAFLARAMLDRIDACTAMEKRLDERIDEQIAPFRRRIDLLVTVPGINTRTAQVILAEIGADIAHFPTAADLASWAGVCPGNNESGGRKGPARIRQGDPWLKAALGQAAVSASRTKDACLAARDPAHHRPPRQEESPGRPPALDPHLRLALFPHDAEYADLSGRYFIERTGRARQTRRLVSQLNQLGYHVNLQTDGTV